MKDGSLNNRNNPLEATALEHGFVPESDGLAAIDSERRIMSSLPHIAYMVSRPRQDPDQGEAMLRRQHAASRPYWLQDWQQGFGGFAKVYRFVADNVVKTQEDELSGPCD